MQKFKKLESSLLESYPPSFSENIGVKYEPAVSLLSSIWDISKKQSISTRDFKIFCYGAIVESIKSFLAGKYSKFDAHTTSNCCHGVAVLSIGLISSFRGRESQLEILLSEGENYLSFLQNEFSLDIDQVNWYVPNELIALTRLCILSLIMELDSEKRPITVRSKLKLIWPMSTKFFNKIIALLQKQLSNDVAENYEKYLNEIPSHSSICGIPITIWGRYVKQDYIRADYRGIKYAPSIFSMQVCLAYLILKKMIIAVVNDIQDENGVEILQTVYFFEGNGIDGFRFLQMKEKSDLSDHDPVIVFRGFCKTKSPDAAVFDNHIQDWLDRIPYLILACDRFYPQFPKVKDDPCFNSEPIQPEEPILKSLWEDSLQVSGVCLSNPSLFCLSHIYVESVKNLMIHSICY